MGPIGSPDDAIRKTLDQRVPERHNVIVGRARKAHPFGTRHLYPEIRMRLHQLVEALVLGVIDALLHARRTHVVYHDGRRQGREEWLKLRQIRHLEIHHDVPPQRSHPSGNARKHVARGEIDEPLDEVEANALDARAVHPLELVLSDFLTHEGHALGLAAGTLQRIHHGPVVLAVTARLDDHVFVQAEKITQREELLLRRIARRVFALRRIGKSRFRSEHVTMGIDRARWGPVFRLGRIAMKRNVAGAHRHGNLQQE